MFGPVDVVDEPSYEIQRNLVFSARLYYISQSFFACMRTIRTSQNDLRGNPLTGDLQWFHAGRHYLQPVHARSEKMDRICRLCCGFVA